MNLSKLQQEIIDAPYDKIVVNSAAASGKTRLLIEKIRQLLRANVNPREVVVITFTNTAAGVLKERLGEDYKDGLFIGTIHSLANQMLLRAGIHTGAVLDKEKFDELFPLIKRNPKCIWSIDWLLLDEAQDSNEGQFEFIFDMIKPSHFFVVGDPRQSIYRWNGSNPELFIDLMNKKDVKSFSMNENYRNRSNILAHAKMYLSEIGQRDDSIPMQYGGKVVTSTYYSIPAIIKYIKEDPRYSQWAILCRLNGPIDKIMAALKYEGIPCDSFKQGDLTKDQLTEKMQANTVKVLTVHSAKGLEWDNVAVTGLFINNDIEEYNIAYVACTRARNMLVVLGKATPKKNKKVRKNEFRFE